MNVILEDEKKVQVRFLRSSGAYNPGDIAVFDREQAAKLCSYQADGATRIAEPTTSEMGRRLRGLKVKKDEETGEEVVEEKSARPRLSERKEGRGRGRSDEEDE